MIVFDIAEALFDHRFHILAQHGDRFYFAMRVALPDDYKLLEHPQVRHRQMVVKRGYEPVYTPHIGKAQLWETSGHLGYYKENMFPAMTAEEGDYYTKPMNCPFHILIYRSRGRSYRDRCLKGVSESAKLKVDAVQPFHPGLAFKMLLLLKRLRNAADVLSRVPPRDGSDAGSVPPQECPAFLTALSHEMSLVPSGRRTHPDCTLDRPTSLEKGGFMKQSITLRILVVSCIALLAAPAAFTRQTGEAHWHVLQRARAVENGNELEARTPGRAKEIERGRNLPSGQWLAWLRRILANLLGNAFKFTAQTPEARIRLYQDPAAVEQTIVVDDNGRISSVTTFLDRAPVGFDPHAHA